MSMGRGQARTLVGRRVSVGSGRALPGRALPGRVGGTGEIRFYHEKDHRFLVRLDTPQKDQLNRLSDWHTCPVGHVQLL